MKYTPITDDERMEILRAIKEMSEEKRDEYVEEMVDTIEDLKKDRQAFAIAIEEIIRFCYAELFFLDSDPAWDLYKGIQQVVAERLNVPQRQLVDDMWKHFVGANERATKIETERDEAQKRVAELEEKLNDSQGTDAGGERGTGPEEGGERSNSSEHEHLVVRPEIHRPGELDGELL